MDRIGSTHRKLGRPQHHDRPHRGAGRLRREAAQKFGVTGFGEAGAIEHIFGNRIGHQRRRLAREHVTDAEPDGGNRGRRARLVGMAGRRGHGSAEIDHGKGRGEYRRGL